MPATYNILLMGASYGSLLASKLLFGGHSIHLVCLPAEADLINAEGFKVTSAGARPQGAGAARIAQAAGQGDGGAGRRRRSESITILSACACRSRNIARPACANCSTRWQVARAVHVDHEHAAAALYQAHPRPRLQGAGSRPIPIRASGIRSIRTRSRSTAPIRRRSARPTARPTSCWSRCRPISNARASTDDKPTRRSSASSRKTSTRRASTRPKARSSCRSS